MENSYTVKTRKAISKYVGARGGTVSTVRVEYRIQAPNGTLLTDITTRFSTMEAAQTFADASNAARQERLG